MKVLQGISWMLGGTLGFAVWQWSMMLFAAQLSGGADIVGRLSVALAISTPAFLLLGMSLRQIAAADVAKAHSTVEYYCVRVVSVLTAVLINIALSMFVVSEADQWLISGVSLLKAVEALADVSYGTMQRDGREAFAGKSQMCKALVQAVLFGCLMAGGGTVSLSLLLVAALSLAMHLMLDITDLRHGLASSWSATRLLKIWLGCARLVRSAIQSGVAASLIAVAAGWPRYILQQQFDSTSAGLFTAAMWIFIPGHILSNAVCQSLLHRAAAANMERWSNGFARYLAGFALVSGLVALLPFAIYLIAGIELPGLLFGSGFEIGFDLFVWATVTNVAVGIASGLNYGIAAGRNYRGQLLSALCATAVCVSITGLLVASMKLEGAFAAVLASALTQAGLTAAFLVFRTSSRGMRVA